MARSTKPAPKRPNLTIRLDPLARATLRRLAIDQGTTQTAVLEWLILTAAENPDGYYLRSAAINSFTAAALARVLLGVVAPGHPQLTAALGVVDGVARNMFGELPAPPSGVGDLDEADSRVASVLSAFGLLDPQE